MFVLFHSFMDMPAYALACIRHQSDTMRCAPTRTCCLQSKIERLQAKIERLRTEMMEDVQKKGLRHPQSIAASQRLDNALNEYTTYINQNRRDKLQKK